MRHSISTHWLLFLLLFFVLMAVNVLTVSAGERRVAQDIAWAQAVITFKAGAGTIGANFSDPANALGSLDANIVSMGNAQVPSEPPADPTACEAVLILSFGEYSVVDGEGDDLTIYESAVGSLLEPIWVYIGDETTGWLYLGESTGGKDSLDISGVAAPSDSFYQIALCDIPDGDTTIGATPGPDIDAVSANNTSRTGLVIQAQGPGWFIDQDPARAFNVLTPIVEFKDLFVQPRALLQFQCPADSSLDDFTSYLIVKSHCDGDLTLTNPLFYWYPLPNPTLRDLVGGYELINVDRYYGFCGEKSGRTISATPEPIAVFSLQEGGARFLVVEEAWRFELQLPDASVYSEGGNHFTITHDPALEESTIQVLGGSVEVDPTAADEDPFALSGGQQVIITSDGPGPVTTIAQVFLPVTIQ